MSSDTGLSEETPGLPTGDIAQDPGQGTAEPAFVTISSERLQNIEARVDTLNQMVRSLHAQSNVPSGKMSSAARSGTDLSNISIEPPEPSSGLIGHLSMQSGGRVRYVEQSFWASICREVAELDDLLGSQSRYLMKSAATKSPDDDELSESDSEDDQHSRVGAEPSTLLDPGDPSHFRLVGDIVSNPPAFTPEQQVSTRTVAHNPEFLKQIPPKQLCDTLVDAYVTGYHPVVLLIHVPTFRIRYDEFWRGRNAPGAGGQTSMAFAALMLALLYAGSVACPERVEPMVEGDPEPEEVATRLHKLALRAIRLANFPRTPTLESFTAYLICQSTWMREEEPLTCVAFVGLALRVANLLGLHKDPSHFPAISAIEAETRRRVWWHLVHIDVCVAIASGLPPIVDASSWDVEGISELKEEHIGTAIGTQYDVAVKKVERPHDTVDDPRSHANRSMISTAGILVAGKLMYSRKYVVLAHCLHY